MAHKSGDGFSTYGTLFWDAACHDKSRMAILHFWAILYFDILSEVDYAKFKTAFQNRNVDVMKAVLRSAPDRNYIS